MLCVNGFHIIQKGTNGFQHTHTLYIRKYIFRLYDLYALLC